jgi:septal ring factor EnvC (AmiA/AmiB activator)
MCGSCTLGRQRWAQAKRRSSLAKEMARQERAVERYQDAFEAGDLDALNKRLSALDARLDAVHDQDQALAGELAVEAPTTPDTAPPTVVCAQDPQWAKLPCAQTT